ncbi:MAG TPA: amino acid ABC transporter permease [Nocardioides sp.]|jgi:polar amino acid transport system permease protein|nr:amino acid ABC transporter permease [Nocardioides sp.]
MSSTGLVTDELQPSPEPAAPPDVTRIAVVAVVLTAVATAGAAYEGSLIRSYNHNSAVSTIVAVLIVLASALAWWSCVKSLRAIPARSSLIRAGKLVDARRLAARGREDAQIALGYAVAGLVVIGILQFVFGNDGAVANTFFDWGPIGKAFGDSLKAFWTNIWVACVAEVGVLIFGLLFAIMRMLPGRAGAPLRLIAVLYCDIFRAIPAIVLIYIIVFGTPLAIPAAGRWPGALLGAIALTITYTAYVAEVYRAGLSSIHPSQSAAARSLGLSYSMTLRTVLVPQAVRRVIPPLLNDFIGLQKDTALLSIGAVAEVFLTTTFFQNTYFKISPVVLAAIFFIVITIPQARFVDYLIDRDAARRAGK